MSISPRLALLALALALTGCTAAEPAGSPAASATPTSPASAATSSPADARSAPATPADVVLPPESGSFDYQLGGAYDPSADGPGPASLDVVARDASAAPLAGAYSICYVNGFQTQPDQADLWDAHPELLLIDDAGEQVVDPDWPDERILDPSTPEAREGILAVIGPVIEGCAADGFDAVEIDNLDTFTRFDGIDEEGALALAQSYVDLAHAQGLAIGQKNSAEITRRAHDELGFDFAVTEECGAWDECAAYTDVYGARVLQIEYPGSLAEAGLAFADVCALPDRAPMTILRDLDLVAPDDPAYVYETC